MGEARRKNEFSLLNGILDCGGESRGGGRMGEKKRKLYLWPQGFINGMFQLGGGKGALAGEAFWAKLGEAGMYQ